MVDENLPKQDRRLRVLFVDFNAFFASCEQQERPELRGKPVAVSPVDSDTTSAIAASYEAKKFGVKCGTPIWEAKQMCPGLVVVGARPRIYKGYHEALQQVLSTVLPVQKVHSIDEMSFRLLGEEREPAAARKIALAMKDAVQRHVGDYMGCSIGIAPNEFLAKMGTEVQKPNGLVVLEAKNLPGPLLDLKLTDFTGINKGMSRRLKAAMVYTPKDMYALSREQLRLAFGSITGERWWFWLRGYELPEEERQRQTLSHSHVLGPELRNPKSSREVLMRLLQKAAARLRSVNLYTSAMTVSVIGSGKTWTAERRFDATQDSVRLQRELDLAWPSMDASGIRQVGVVFHHLCTLDSITPSLFAEPKELATMKLSSTLDQVNKKFGKNSVFLAGIHQVKDSADEKIAFQKTWLFSEGKDDNDWIDTFRGLTKDLADPG